MEHIKKFFLPSKAKALLTSVGALLLIPFIQYDTGVRCITEPCPSSGINTFVGFLFGENGEIISIEYGIFIISLVGLYLLVSTIIELISDFRTHVK